MLYTAKKPLKLLSSSYLDKATQFMSLECFDFCAHAQLFKGEFSVDFMVPTKPPK